MQGQWMSINEYARLAQVDQEEVEALIMRGKLATTIEDGEVRIDASQTMSNMIPTTLSELSSGEEINVGASFVEKTIGTIISLHEKVLVAKDETIESVRAENEFLKEALASLQELYNEDRRTIETLTEQLKLSQQEVEFMRRKYKLMWGKVIEDHAAL